MMNTIVRQGLAREQSYTSDTDNLSDRSKHKFYTFGQISVAIADIGCFRIYKKSFDTSVKQHEVIIIFAGSQKEFWNCDKTCCECDTYEEAVQKLEEYEAKRNAAVEEQLAKEKQEKAENKIQDDIRGCLWGEDYS